MHKCRANGLRYFLLQTIVAGTNGMRRAPRHKNGLVDRGLCLIWRQVKHPERCLPDVTCEEPSVRVDQQGHASLVQMRFDQMRHKCTCVYRCGSSLCVPTARETGSFKRSPGAIAHTRIPCGARSRAHGSVILTIAPLDAAYAA